jgi:hypothetical protein
MTNTAVSAASIIGCHQSGPMWTRTTAPTMGRSVNDTQCESVIVWVVPSTS